MHGRMIMPNSLLPTDRHRMCPACSLLLCCLLLVCLAAGGCAGRPAAPAPSRPAVPDLAPSARARAVVHTARTGIGTPYAWGGCTPEQGFDCSGLVWWAFSENALSIPRTTEAQMNAGTDTHCTALRQGDILFFRISSKGLHAGIYTGDGRFVHSPKSGHTVREESMRKAYWQQRLLACRRVAP